MKDQGEAFLLLFEIARLLRKFGPEPFETLARMLSDPNAVQTFETLLKSAARSGHSKIVSSRIKTQPIGKLFASLEKSSPKKHEMLVRFYNEFTEGNLLQTLSDVRRFASDWKLVAAGSSRRKMASSLFSSLAALPTKRLDEAIQAASKRSAPDRELEGWSRVILDRGQRPKT